ncbi:hypothetical protein [Inquilinus limosus]|uniref:Uncharacterized protein n=1 Tax=Inquilinus limosus MP06 TaxID=1398085 RepID=A0A0A0D747_9PROT|nr:hypothetical protein [Inquilinus limosus]KGM34491.1 hypothetical protein P409_09945 [Inquilinus limosus MP06]
MSEPRSSLSRRQPRPPTEIEQLRRMRAAAWHGQGVVVIRPEEVEDDWIRQAIVNEADRLYGKRNREP